MSLADIDYEWVEGEDPEQLLRREWLVTNGLGGYASGTLLGPHSRKYHGLLVPNLADPSGRHILLSSLDDQVEGKGDWCRLTGHMDLDGTLQTDTPAALRRFRLERGMPVWEFATARGVLERRIVMAHHQNLVCVHYRPQLHGQGMSLRLRPYFTLRRHDDDPSIASTDPGTFTVQREASHVLVELGAHKPALSVRFALLAARAAFVEEPLSRTQLYRLEGARGYTDAERVYSPGYFVADLSPGEEAAFVVSTQVLDLNALDPHALVQAEGRRVDQLIAAANVGEDELAARLVVAADQFIVRPGSRPEEAMMAEASGSRVRTVIAGYHWFGDWGRDTMISLEGLTLCTGRAGEAGAILRTFAGYVQDGLLPNLFPEGARAALYHTVDATLWYFHAIDRYTTVSGDLSVLAEIIPVLESVIEHHVSGTRFGIGVDPADGLIHAGAEGYQLTWMDAKAGDWVVTPRRGKPVEVQALWYNALRLMADWSVRLGRSERDYASRAAQARAAFNDRYWSEAKQHLYDVVDGEQGDDSSGRPNQIFAMSLRYPVLAPERWRAVLEFVERELLTPYGLRTLSRDHPDYKRSYEGDLLTRDGAYHQGTVWPWLIGHYVDAVLRVRCAAQGATRTPGANLNAFLTHLSDCGMGTIAEIFDADSPYEPRGCIAQAWSVAEVLRARLRLMS